MTIDYNKVWQVMNDLEELTPKLCTIKELIEYSAEAAPTDSLKSEYLSYAARDLLINYLNEWDDRFKKAWNNTVIALKDVELQDWRERHYAQQEEQQSQSWTVSVEQDMEEFVLTFPEELVSMKGWKEGDQLEWIDRKDGSYEIRKVEN